MVDAKCRNLVQLGCSIALSATSLFGATMAAQPNAATIYAPRDVGPLVKFHDATTNIDLVYPKGWQVVEHPDKDSLVKISGTTSDGVYGELKISNYPDTSSAETVAKTMETQIGLAMPGASKLSLEKIRFGDRYQLTGQDLMVTFKVGDALYRDRMVFFSRGSEVSAISFICLDKENARMTPLFNKILLNVHSVRTGTTAVYSPGKTVGQSPLTGWRLSRFTDKSGLVSIGYPEGWRVINNDPSKDFDVKLSGNNAQGLGAELFMSRTERPPGMSLDEFMSTFEQAYLKPLKDFRKVSTNRQSFGMSRSEGIVTNATFMADGHPARQTTAFFADSGHYYCVALNSILWTEKETRALMDQVLGSIKLSD